MHTRYRITTPTPGFSGHSADVAFTDGCAELVITSEDPQDEQRRRLAYFREAGYGVTALDDEGEPVTDDPGRAAEPMPADSASDFRWRLYAVQHAGMAVADVDALGDRADVMRAVRERVERRTGKPASEATDEPSKSAGRRRGTRKASAAPGENATADELREFVKARAIEAGDTALAGKADGMSRDELAAQAKELAK